jgi:hypothetical protein
VYFIREIEFSTVSDARLVLCLGFMKVVMNVICLIGQKKCVVFCTFNIAFPVCVNLADVDLFVN